MKTVLAPTHPEAAIPRRGEYLRPVLSAGLRCRFPGGAQVLVVLLFFALTGALRADSATDSAPLRLGFADNVFGDVNESDSHAVLKIWVRTIGIERGADIDPDISFFGSTAEIEAAMLGGKVDGVLLKTVDFWSLRAKVPVGPTVIESVRNGKTTEEFILLVRREDPAVRLADLRGRNLAIVGSSSTSLPAIWLETLLLENQLGTLDSFSGQTTHTLKASRVVLPVFFRKLDACVITVDAFRLLCELNPQVGKQLRILAQSPEYKPTIFCFRRNLTSRSYNILINSLDGVTTTEAGRQTMALFQTDKIASGPVSLMDPTLALLDHYHQLREAADHAATKLTATADEPKNRGASQ